MAAIATGFGPSSCVSNALGRWRTCAARGRAPRRPMTNGVAPNWSAHAVSTVPPVQVATSSAAAPSA